MKAYVDMKKMLLSKAFTLTESGPVVLVTTNDGRKNSIMTISWTMVVDGHKLIRRKMMQSKLPDGV
jgi:flavin reductase (DIM6/NTAB) family NADH-FMN oxidoreductase RutF